MSKNPRFSIVIPALDEEKYLGRLLESLKLQTCGDYEIIVIDSYSRDKTVTIARKYGTRILYSKKGNIAKAKNTGIKAARGKIIAFIDADMVLSRTVLSAVDAVFSETKGKVVGIEPVQKLNKDDVSEGKVGLFEFVAKLVWLNKVLSFRTKMPVATGCVFCAANAVAKAGFFNERLLVSEDRDYYHRLSKYGKFVIIKDYALVSFRRQEKEGLLKPALQYYKSDISSFLFKRVKKGMKLVR